MRHMALGTTLEQPVPRRMRDDRGSLEASEQCPFSARLPDSISDDFILRPLTLLDPNKQIAVEAAKQLPCSIFAWLGLAFSPLLYSRTQKNFTFDLTCAIQEISVEN